VEQDDVPRHLDIMTPTDTYTLLRAFCDELARCGLEHACTSPGSRSTPIVLSLAREPRIRCWSHIDERSAAFFALGAAKASGRPVALACTSGTAAANFAPAVIEAHWARVPLIVLTADRPPELRGVGAGQAIDQLGLYGGAVKWFFELGVHEADAARLRWMRTLACRAYWTALDGPPGPVHLNLPLREPLVLDRPLPEDRSGRPEGRPWVARTRPRHAAPAPGLDLELPARGVVVAGRDERDPGLGAALAAWSAEAGYPLLADPLSGARRGPAAIAHYDLLVRSKAFTDTVRPELVLRVGDLPTSKPLRAWLAGLGDVPQVAVDPEGAWHDPDGVVSERLAVDPALALAALTVDRSPDREWLARWRAADAATAAAIDSTLGSGLSEPLVARSLVEWLAPSATLVSASSMPIRDLEEFAAVRDAPPRILSNRGANGIDGTISTAFGVAAADPSGPVVVLVGDVALAYDVGGLLSARRLDLPLTIVLLNNDGGGIFHFLPVAGQTDAFEEHVATPHGLRFELAAQLYGCVFVRADTSQELEQAVLESVPRRGVTIIEVITDREANLALHRRVAEAAAAAAR
jgi:2-succinyl-5-enolpyruvyl-6-hydroxy-3-cyclohexene-1-carboxylate synthase